LIGPFTSFMIGVIIFAVIIVVVLGLLAQQGYEWFKWVYLCLYLLGLTSVFNTLPLTFHASQIAGYIGILHYVIQAIAIIYLFSKHKSPQTSFSVAEESPTSEI
jgi:hypothetical protein